MRMHSDALYGLTECLRPLTRGHKNDTFYNALIASDGETLIASNGAMIAEIAVDDCPPGLRGWEINGVDLVVTAKLHLKASMVIMGWDGDSPHVTGWDAKRGPHSLRIQEKRTVPANTELLLAETPIAYSNAGRFGSIDTATLARAAKAFSRYRSVAAMPLLDEGRGTWLMSGNGLSRLSILCGRVASAI